MSALGALIAGSGLPPDTPVVVAACDRDGVVEVAVAGTWPSGRAVAAHDMFYAASLAKQVTGAALALLVRRGLVSADAPVADYDAALPAWIGRATLREIVHHTAALPAAGEIETRIAPAHWTEDAVLEALRELPEPERTRGSAHIYSNLGYLLLARVIARVADRPFPDFVSRHILAPAGIEGMVFAAGDLARFEQAALMGAQRPLTLGDGGLWTTAQGFARWLDAQNRDVLGIAPLVEAPGRLTRGAPIDYGWGIGIRTFRGRPLFVHGGSWTGAIARSVRSPFLKLSVVALAAGGSSDLMNGLVRGVLEDLAP